MGDKLPFAKLYPALPPMPPSPSPPFPPPKPPAPNPPYPAYDLSKSRDLALQSLPSTLAGAFTSRQGFVFYVDEGQPTNLSQAILQGVEDQRNPNSFSVSVTRSLKDNGLIVAAIILGSITGACVRLGRCVRSLSPCGLHSPVPNISRPRTTCGVVVPGPQVLWCWWACAPPSGTGCW